MLQNEWDISGSYLGPCTGIFAVGTAHTHRKHYDHMLEHLKEVLANATPTGNPHWGRVGVYVTSWTHNGKEVIKRETETINGEIINRGDAPLAFHTLEAFEQKLAELDAAH